MLPSKVVNIAIIQPHIPLGVVRIGGVGEGEHCYDVCRIWYRIREAVLLAP